MKNARGLDRTIVPYALLAFGILGWVSLSNLVLGPSNVGQDIWEHAAAVKELATNPHNPSHPMILGMYPHHLFNPYSYAASLLARYAACEPMQILLWMGLLNALAVILSVRLFVASFAGLRSFGEGAGHARVNLTAFLLLFTTVFLCSFSQGWSGFFDVRSLRNLTPLPATLSMGVVLLTWSLYLHAWNETSYRLLFPVTLSLAILLLVHPYSALSAYIGIGVMTISMANRAHLRFSLVLAALGLVTLVCSAFWPYFSVWKLDTASADAFSTTQSSLYYDSLRRLGPSLVAIPAVIARLKRDRKDPIAAGVVAFSLVFLVGAASRNLNLIRTMPFLLLFLQLSLALQLADWVSRRMPERLWVRSALVLFVLGGLAATGFLWHFTNGSIGSAFRGPRIDKAYARLSAQIGQYDVVVAEEPTGFPLPAFSGKVIAIPRPMPFVDDADLRRQVVQRFFSDDCPDTERWQTIRRYEASYILVDTLKSREGVLGGISRLGRVVAHDRSLMLFRIEPPPSRIGTM